MAASETMKLLQEINSEHPSIKFNTHQSRSLRKVCLVISEYLKLWKACNQIKLPDLALEELACCIHRASNLIHLCRDDQSWLLNAAIRLNNSGEFAAIFFSLGRIAGLINSQIILAAGDDANSPEIQALMSKPQQHAELAFDDLESAVEGLNPCLEVDRLELLLKARSLPTENVLRSYLLKKLEGTLPMIQPLELRDMVGGGAFGTVFKAEWMGIPVAVKEFREGDMSFEKELKILRALMLEPDPNVLQIIGYYHRDDKAYLVMELMEADLARVIRKNHSSLQLREMIDIMLQVASGMLYLHERNVVHRDLKPSNILVETRRASPDHECFNIRLTDFGFSRTDFVSFASDLTYQRGTLLYMAPEMFRGQKYSREVDVYSFGVTCFQLLTGTLPFQDGNGKQMIAEKLIEMIEAGSRPDLPMNCPTELATLINRCWNTNPKDRPNFQNITRILSSLKDKLLFSHPRDFLAELKDPAADDFAGAASDLIEKICITTPYTNVLQSNFIKSRCMQVSGKLEAWKSPELPSGIAVMRKLIATLRSALSLIESYTRECWLRTALTKLHNPSEFRSISQEIVWCTGMLELETERLKGGKQVEHPNSIIRDPQDMALDLLAQYSEDDRKRMIETAGEIASGSLRASSGVNRKIAEYLVKKLTARELVYVQPEDIVLQNVIGMSKNGAVFKASWLGKTVAVKRLRMRLPELETRAGLKFFEQKQYQFLRNAHPNLTSILGYTKHGEDFLLIVEFTNGGLLRLTGKPFPPLLAVEVLLQLAKGMEYLLENNFELLDFNTILIDYEQSESEGFTGALRVKIAMYTSSIAPLKSQFKDASIHRFGAACFEMITGKAIEADTFLSGRLSNLPPECPSSIQLMMKRCSSSSPPEFREIIATLRSAKLEMESNSTGSRIDYRRMLLKIQDAQSDVNELELMGHGIVGEKLIVIVNMDRVQNRLYQWVRQHRDGTIERLRPFLVSGTESGTLEYSLTADDYDKAISLNFVDMNEKIEMAGRATTNSRWISCGDKMKRAIKNAWDAGAARFRVSLLERPRKKCYLVITRSYYLISWRKLLVKTIKEKTPFSSSACIRMSREETLVCSLIDDGGSTWNVRFKDSSTRDFAVLTFRHFAKMNSLVRRMNSRKLL